RVQVLDSALEAAVKLSHRYIPDRQLPDKAVSLLDTACARVAVSHHATPADVEDCERHIEALNTEKDIIGREGAIGMEVRDRLSGVGEALRKAAERLGVLRDAWSREKKLVDEILSLRSKLREDTGRADAPASGATGQSPAAAGPAPGAPASPPAGA